MKEKHVGNDFDDFLREEGLLEDVEAVAARRVLAYQSAAHTAATGSRGAGDGPAGNSSPR